MKTIDQMDTSELRSVAAELSKTTPRDRATAREATALISDLLKVVEIKKLASQD